ncbi:hypothetical protein [Crateriforma spongiae]|uniref:hypothetical protein n=1 Tax=Crateriforma spongiae TaxID=2724528 RepID=UPI0039B04B8E
MLAPNTHNLSPARCRDPIALLAIVSLLLALAGCSDDRIDVTGVVRIDGQAPDIEPREVMKVSLVPEQQSEQAIDGDQTATATVQRDGSFVLSHVMPGSYRVTVADFASYPSDDRLARFFRGNPNAIRVQVPADEPLKIDVQSDWLSGLQRRR